MSEESGRLVAGRYRLVGLLGRGGMGAVWRARDEALDREVAVKQLTLPEHLPDDRKAGLIERVRREARAAAKLSHPGIITVHDQFTDDSGHPWIVMEVVQGRSLDDLVKAEGPLPVAEVARIGARMLEALGAAHDAGITHRDVKPANVLLAGDRVVLTDFGIAAIDGDATLTATGAIMGTPAFMSPEQLDGRAATPASDLWSLGATLYTAVEGRRPFEGASLTAIYAAILTKHPDPPVHAGPLVPVLQGLLSKDPADRVATGLAAPQRLAEIAGAPAPAVPGPRPALLPSAPAGVQAGSPGWTASPGPRADRWPVPPGGTDPAVPPGSGTTVPPASAPTAWPGTVPGDVRPRRSRKGLYLSLAAFFTAVAAVVSLGVYKIVLSEDPRHIARLGGHTGAVVEAAFSPDGALLATAGADDRLIRLWDVRTRKQVAGSPLAGQGDTTALAFGPDGSLLVTGDHLGNVLLWNPRTGKQLDRPRLVHDKAISALAVAPDGNTLAVGERDGRIRLWDVRNRRPVGEPIAGGGEGGKGDMALAFRPAGALIVVETRRAWALDVQRRQPVGGPLAIPDDDHFFALAVSRDGGIFATGGARSVHLWDVTARRKLGRPLGGHSGAILAIALSPDGTTLAAGGDDHRVRLWDVRTGRSAGEPLADHVFDVHALAFSPDGKVLAVGEGSGGEDSGSVRLWSVR